MNLADKIKEEYRAQVQMLFSDHPAALDTFKQMWEAGSYREMYFFVYATICQNDMVLTPEQKYTDERFYWEIVN